MATSFVRRRKNFEKRRRMLLLAGYVGWQHQLNLKSCWVKPKSNVWWQDVVPNYTDEDFQKNFRMQRSTFIGLVEELRPHIEKKKTRFSFQHRLFEKTGCLLTTDGSGDHLVQPEGLPVYKVPFPTMLEPTPPFAVFSRSEGESKDDDDQSLQYVGSDEEENGMLVEVRSIDDRNIFYLAPVSVEKRVAVALWRLATNCEFRTLGSLFGIGCATASKICNQVCDAIVKHLTPTYVKFPSGENLRNICEGFQEIGRLPLVCGAIDCCHIPIIGPKADKSDYYNIKGFYSIILQGVADHNGLFIDVGAGWAGKSHDAKIFQSSNFHAKLENGLSNDIDPIQIGGVEILPYVIGDAAYPMSHCLMKPYPDDETLSSAKQNFNFNLSKCRSVIEHAFGRLKSRWRCLAKRLDSPSDKVPTIIVSCCTLHNYCEMNNDRLEDIEVQEMSTENDNELEIIQQNSEPSSDAKGIRTALTEYLS
ncbi:Protein ANTAGONIST OF LIKE HETEROCHROMATIN PROTEIN 1 [Nymphon striatum]|nr:Protein ANTAGONIST OF LIKE HETEROCHROMATIN PROTEIN 1 [Nymphon striatum]